LKEEVRGHLIFARAIYSGERDRAMSTCPGCGQRAEEGQAVCSNCGHGLPDAEQATAVAQRPAPATRGYLEEFSVRDNTEAHYDVYVAGDKFTFIKTQSGATGSGALWTALLGGIIYGRLTRRKYGDDMTLEQKLATSKGSFVVTGDALISLRLAKVLGQHVLEVEFTGSRGKSSSMRLTMKGESYDALAKLLPTLPALSSKVR
jgi:hypothetical protein